MKKIIILGIITFSSISQAYMSLMTTGDMVEANQFQALGYLEHIFNRYDGTNINARGTMGINDELSGDIELGLGELDIMIGAFAKWVPIPDHDKQPAIGIRGGISYIDEDSFTQTSITAMPFLSKSFNTEYGKYTPFGGIPFGLNSNDKDDYFTARLALGTEWTPADEEFKQLRVIGELGFNLSKSFGSFNLGASWNF